MRVVKTVKSADGRVLRKPVEVRERWEEYFKELLNEEFPRREAEEEQPTEGPIPPWTQEEGKTSRAFLLYKREDVYGIGNYRPISLLSVVYKRFTRAILNRISRTLDEGQPREQEGFRRGFSTIEHIHTTTKLTEVSREYKLPLCVAFM
ncbi:unnamed protein product [Heligmosomoides polygyrus]|uniref:Reverse transcriptase domain-containing protein n=1 Tax=Heligmosomoides polygyrus TaxID=6339 RepID=A0A3P8A1Z5_HELPZ|nr:unnamed protein product [Heligmosomoides polygyrus]